MPLEEKAKFLKERSLKIQNSEALKSKSKEQKKIKEKKLLLARERKRDEEKDELAPPKKLLQPLNSEKPKPKDKESKDLKKQPSPLKLKSISEQKPQSKPVQLTPIKKSSAKPSAKKSTPAIQKVSSSKGPSMNSMSYLVEQFSQRWWYALPAYPPENFDYKPDLEKRKLNCVSKGDFLKLKNANPEESKHLVNPVKEKGKKDQPEKISKTKS